MISSYMLSLLLFALVLFSSSLEGKLVGKAYPFEIPDATFNVVTYGAKGDGKTDDTKAIQAAFEAAKSSGGTVEFPAGNYLTFPFTFSGSNTVMNLASGATILAQTDKTAWPGKGATAFIGADNVNNIGITGSGKVNGQGSAWWGNPDTTRPNLMQVNAVHRLYIQGVTFEDSPNHNLELGASFTEIDGVTITAPGNSPNTDGVDLHGTPFYIHDSHISVGDDNVAIHNSNILIENCAFGTGHGASIGSINSGTYTNITIRGITIDGAVAGPRIKTDAGAPGSISGVTYENITLTNVQTGIVIDMFYDNGKNETTTMKISDITYSNIKGTASVAGSLKCQPSSPCKNIILKDIKITDSKGWECLEVYGSVDSVSPSSCVKTSMDEY